MSAPWVCGSASLGQRPRQRWSGSMSLAMGCTSRRHMQKNKLRRESRNAGARNGARVRMSCVHEHKKDCVSVIEVHGSTRVSRFDVPAFGRDLHFGECVCQPRVLTQRYGIGVARRDRRMNRYDVSVVICTWNRADHLRKTLRSLMDMRVGTDVRWDIVVVD